MIKPRNFLLSLILVGSVNFCFCQTRDSIISGVKAKCVDIYSDRHTCDTAMLTIWDESAEGGEAIAYYRNDRLVLMELIFLGETGKREMKFYYDNGQVIHLHESRSTYNRPIYWDSLRMKQSNDTLVFDTAKTVVEIDEYYFQSGKLIYWLDHNGVDVDLTQGTNTLAGQGIIAYASKMQERFSK